MKVDYQYISSVDYIRGLAFDYVETYSFQRGAAYAEEMKSQNQKYESLQRRKAKKNDLSEEGEQKLETLKSLLDYTQFLINADDVFHSSSRKMNTFCHSDPQIAVLKEILETEVIHVPMFMCAPVYRDAIVFYDVSGNILSVLHICLSCDQMALAMYEHVNADEKTYGLLRQFLLDIGHDVES